MALQPIDYSRHRFPDEVIRYAVWLYFHFRFTLSLRDVEELLAQRGIEVSYETIRCWTLKFGKRPVFPTLQGRAVSRGSATATRELSHIWSTI